jgi:hypothetical protein
MIKDLQGFTDWAVRWQDALENLEASVRTGKRITLKQTSEVKVTEPGMPLLE